MPDQTPETETLPIPGYDDDDMRRWLFASERTVIEACVCRDLSCNITIAVCLDEHQALRAGKRPPRKRTPEQDEREKVASGHVNGRLIGYQNVVQMLRLIAELRRGIEKSRAEVAELSALVQAVRSERG